MLEVDDDQEEDYDDDDNGLRKTRGRRRDSEFSKLLAAVSLLCGPLDRIEIDLVPINMCLVCK